MRMEIDIQGLSQLTRQLGELTGDADAALLEVITRAVTDTRRLAVQGIERGPASGRVYTHHFWTDANGKLRRGRERAKPHRASAEGQYPMNDTGRLATSIAVENPAIGRMRGAVGTDVMYGRYLEFGTSRMRARPWLLRSFKTATADIEKLLKKAIEARI